MRYRNVKTGTVIRTTCKVVGKDWESLEEITQQSSAEDPPEDDTIEDDTTEEAPVKKARARRGNK